MSNVLAFVLAFVFFLGGLALFAFAFNVPSVEALLFVLGIACVTISLAIPFHVLGHGEQR
jgi:cytochrome c oxidase assembly factor CtaG